MVGGDLMKVGDLVRHIRIKHSRQVGVITEVKNFITSDPRHQKYKVLWSCTQTEEYWFSGHEVEALCK